MIKIELVKGCGKKEQKRKAGARSNARYTLGARYTIYDVGKGDL